MAEKTKETMRRAREGKPKKAQVLRKALKNAKRD